MWAPRLGSRSCLRSLPFGRLQERDPSGHIVHEAALYLLALLLPHRLRRLDRERPARRDERRQQTDGYHERRHEEQQEHALARHQVSQRDGCGDRVFRRKADGRIAQLKTPAVATRDRSPTQRSCR